jgi:hypothetical protein
MCVFTPQGIWRRKKGCGPCHLCNNTLLLSNCKEEPIDRAAELVAQLMIVPHA